MHKHNVLDAINDAVDYYINNYVNERKTAYITRIKSNFQPKRRLFGLLPPNKLELTDTEAEARWTEKEDWHGFCIESNEEITINTRNNKIKQLLDLQFKVVSDCTSFIVLEDSDFELIVGFLSKDGV